MKLHNQILNWIELNLRALMWKSSQWSKMTNNCELLKKILVFIYIILIRSIIVLVLIIRTMISFPRNYICHPSGVFERWCRVALRWNCSGPWPSKEIIVYYCIFQPRASSVQVPWVTLWPVDPESCALFLHSPPEFPLSSSSVPPQFLLSSCSVPIQFLLNSISVPA